MWLLAVDFGTSFTAAAVRSHAGSVELLDLDGRGRMASCVFFDRAQEKLQAGRVAWNSRLRDVSAFQRTPKRLIERSEQALLGDRRFGVDELIAAVLEHVLVSAQRLDEDPPAEIRLTYPARFGDEFRGVLESAAAHALDRMGWSDVPREWVPEPVAAAIDAARGRDIPSGSCLAVYDLGGGTFDVAVVRRNGTGFEVIGEPGGDERCGGEDFDERLLGELDGRLGSMDGWSDIRHPDPEDVEKLKYNVLLREEVVRAKEELSSSDFVDVDVRGINHQEQVTRTEFESLVDADLEKTVGLLVDALSDAKRAGIADGDFQAVVLTGGSSRIPLVDRLVRDRTGLPVLVQPDPKGVVAKGAASWEPAPSLPPVPPPPPEIEDRVPDPTEVEPVVSPPPPIEDRPAENGGQVVKQPEQMAAGLVLLAIMAVASFFAVKLAGLVFGGIGIVVNLILAAALFIYLCSRLANS